MMKLEGSEFKEVKQPVDVPAVNLEKKEKAESIFKDIFSRPLGDLIDRYKEENVKNESVCSNEISKEVPEKPVEQLNCRNGGLEGEKHPDTDVPFVRKQITDQNGDIKEGVFPEFDSAFDAQLPEELYEATDREQFKECNAQLKEAVANNNELRDKFDEEQLEQIENGDTPDGYTWHHDAEVGKMQLVDTETHQKTGHTGGRNVWGGGTENR